MVFDHKNGNKDRVREIKQYFRENGEKYSENCVTLIWTSVGIYGSLINSALVVDAVNTDKQLKKDDFQYYFDKLEECKLDYKFVIDKCITYIRILNSAITDGYYSNNEERKAYRATHKDVMPNIKPGQEFRIINYAATSTKKSVAEEYFLKRDPENLIIVEFLIPEGCMNAGLINQIGKSEHSYEEELLIPPYTLAKMISRDRESIKVEIATDNKSKGFEVPVTCV